MNKSFWTKTLMVLSFSFLVSVPFTTFGQPLVIGASDLQSSQAKTNTLLVKKCAEGCIVLDKLDYATFLGHFNNYAEQAFEKGKATCPAPRISPWWEHSRWSGHS